ncbi:MAG: MerR family transcriptional regulator [Marmoricola sp.]
MTAEMSETAEDAELAGLMTVDELAAVTGMTVRTTRYYAGLGLLPPPERRGRVAYYGPTHRARLEFIRSLQDHGFTLAAIEKYLGRVPLDATSEDLSIQRAMLMPWTAQSREVIDRAELAKRAERELTDEEIDVLVRVQALRERDGGYEVLPPFDTAVRMVELGLPQEAYLDAAESIGRHMDELVDELTQTLRTYVVEPVRNAKLSEEEAAEFEERFARLRQLTLESVVAAFQRAANQVITRAVSPGA